METQELLKELRAKMLDKSVTREDVNKALEIEPDTYLARIITHIHTFFCRDHYSSETVSCPYYGEEQLDGTWQHLAHRKWWDITLDLMKTLDVTEGEFKVMLDYFISAISAIEKSPLELYILVEGYLKAETIEQVMRKFSITYPIKKPTPVAPNQASPSSESYSKK
uniref:Uncharacterized protein n=1 Tax=viral metagenome TaxID=1070528 RepID=A0A6M3IZ83_9ZZZZ